MKYKKKQLDAVELGDELLLCEKGSARVHRLNSTAAAIWKLCDGQEDTSEIAKNVAREFRGPSATEIEADVGETLSKMTKLGILDIPSAKGTA